MTHIKQLLTLIGAAVLLMGCVSDDRGSDPQPEVPVIVNPVATLQLAIEQAVDSAIVPAVQRFLTSAEALDSASSNFCSELGEPGLLELQSLWRQLFENWYRLSLYNFGPLNDDIVFPQYTFIDSLRLRGTDYLETVRSEIATDINSNVSLDSDYFARKTFQRVGLLALESAVFETSTTEYSTNPIDVIANYSFEQRKCDVLSQLAAQLVVRAKYIEQGWLVAHIGSDLPYRTLFIDGQLDDGTEPLTQILISSQEFLDYVQARAVVTTASPIATHAWEAISASIDEVVLLLRGDNATSNSLFDVMETTGNQNAIDAVEDSIVQVQQAIVARDTDMLEISLGFLDGNFKREIPDSLELDLGINFSDGD